MENLILSYESDIEHHLWTHSCDMYSVNEEKLLTYLQHRFWIHTMNNNKLSSFEQELIPEAFMTFWMKELGLPLKNLIYNSLELSSQSLRQISMNIFDMLHEREARNVSLPWRIHTYQSFQMARNQAQSWLSEAKKKYRKRKGESIYNTLLRWHLYKRLNHYFSASVEEPSRIKGFTYPDEWHPLSEETKIDRVLQAYRFGLHQTTSVTEEELETYIAEHLHLLGKGFTLIERQKVLPKGRIDLLAKDSEGRMWVIELKVEKDTDVIWQKWYYTNEIQRKYPQKEIGFILIAPTIEKEILEPLLEDDIPTQLYTYRALIAKGTVQDVSLELYKTDK